MGNKTIFKTKAEDATTAILGIQPDSSNIVIPLSEGPHFLVAGTTGSGKSVFINSALASIMAHTHPDELKLTIIDPKTVEFSNYKGLPYMLCDPLTDMSKANTFVQYLVEEMERRYTIFAKHKVKKLAEYQELCQEDDSLEKIPYIILVIDEFADLISQYKDVEKPIARIGQKARAAGIHMVIATQSPRREVITGLIKANVPSRVSLMVANSTESQIILDETGGEKLRPKGDFLLKMNGGNVTRGQAPFVSNGELDEIFAYLRDKYGECKPVDFEQKLREIREARGEDPDGDNKRGSRLGGMAGKSKTMGNSSASKLGNRTKSKITDEDRKQHEKTKEKIEENKKKGKKPPIKHKVNMSKFTKKYRDELRKNKGLDKDEEKNDETTQGNASIKTKRDDYEASEKYQKAANAKKMKEEREKEKQIKTSDNGNDDNKPKTTSTPNNKEPEKPRIRATQVLDNQQSDRRPKRKVRRSSRDRMAGDSAPVRTQADTERVTGRSRHKKKRRTVR